MKTTLFLLGKVLSKRQGKNTHVPRTEVAKLENSEMTAVVQTRFSRNVPYTITAVRDL